MSSFQEIKKLIKGNNWYRQAVDSRQFFLWTPCQAVTDEFNPPAIYVFHKVRWEGFYVEKNLVSQAENFLAKTKKSLIELKKYKQKFIQAAHDLDRIFLKLSKIDLGSLNETNLKKLLAEFDNLVYKFWFVCWLGDKFDPEGFNMLNREIRQAGLSLKEEELETLTQSTELNFIESSELDLYKLVKEHQENRRSISWVKEKLEAYSKKYYYIENSWLVVKILKVDDFLKLFNKLTKLSLKDINERIQELQFCKQNRNKKIKEIVKARNIPQDLQNIFYLYRQLAEFRDFRKIYTLKSNHFYQLFVERLAVLYDLDINLIYRALPHEFIKKDISVLKGSLKRREYSVLLVNKTGPQIIEGNQAKKVIEFLHQTMSAKYSAVKGFSAFPGKVKGRVTLVIGHAHFSKFKTNDILVAPMTRPEYFPLIKKAKAIITDEGGITSHAAIVARELKKPCIVGTQIATQKLVDGNLVEVDATKGIVKILK